MNDTSTTGQPAEGCPVLCLGDIHFLCQTHSNLNAFNESHLFVVSAEGTDSVDDLINFLQWFSVHEPVDPLEVGFDGYVVHTIRTGRKCQQPMM